MILLAVPVYRQTTLVDVIGQQVVYSDIIRTFKILFISSCLDNIIRVFPLVVLLLAYSIKMSFFSTT